MSDTISSIDEIEAMIPAMEALDALIEEGVPYDNEFCTCHYCGSVHGHEPYCAWAKAADALRKWKEVKG